MKKIIFLPIVIFLTSCAAFKISTGSLSTQLNNNVVSKGYLLAKDAVKGNNLNKIKCVSTKMEKK